MRIRCCLFVVATALLSCNVALADDDAAKGEFGHLRGRFVYDGKPPKPKEGVVFKRGLRITDESLIVDRDNLGIANLGIWLYRGRGQPLPPIHPSYGMHTAKLDRPRVKQLTVIKSRLEPHFLILRTDEVLGVVNVDKDACSLRLDMTINPLLRFELPAGGEKLSSFIEPERFPAIISCDIHPWMRARILVQDHPYFAVTDSSGKFEIRDLPAGKHEFVSWHESAGHITSVKRDGILQKWMVGRVKLTILPDDTLDLGDLYVPPELLH